MKRKLFIRKFLSLILILIAPILFLGISIYFYTNYHITRDINLRAQQTAALGNEHLELLLSTGEEQSKLFDNTPALSLSIYKILSNLPLEFKEYSLQSIIFSTLENMKNSNTFIDSVYLYLDNRTGNFFQTDKKTVNLENASDTKWIDVYADMEDDFLIVKRGLKNYDFEQEKEMISVFRRLTNAQGVMVLNLDPGDLGKALDNLQMYETEYIFITDAQGNLLFHNTNGGNLKTDDTASFRQLLQIQDYKDQAGPSQVSLADEKYIMTETVSARNGLHFLSLVPEKDLYRTLNLLIYYILLSLALAFVICLILCYFTVQKNFRQIHYLLDTLWKAENGIEDFNTAYEPRFKDEYDIVLNNLIHTFIHNNTLKLQLQSARLQQTTAELAALQLQINPHFLFNTLQTIDMEITKQLRFGSTASLLTENLSDILRYALEDPNGDVPLREEIHYCSTYMEIQKYRYPGRFSFLWDYEEHITSLPIPRLILQPLLENCLYHGIKPKEDHCFIRIKIVRRPDHIVFFVLDTGVGIPPKKLEELRDQLTLEESLRAPTHIGLRNTQRRLILTYGNEAGLHILGKEGHGACVYFRIPARR